MDRHRVVLAGCLVGLAGCALDGPAAAGPVEYNLTNAGTVEQSLSLGVVDGPVERMELRYSHGTTRSVAVAGPEGSGGPTTGVYDLRNVTGVAVDGRSERVAFTLPPGESSPGELSIPEGATVVLTATADGEVRAVGVARCGDGDRMFYVDLLVGSYGPSVGVGCRAPTR